MDLGIGRFLRLWVEQENTQGPGPGKGKGKGGEWGNHHQLRVCCAFLRSHTVIIYL